MQTLIALEDIEFSRGKRSVLAGVNLSVNRGEVIALIGSNGVGKTTLLSIAAQLFAPSRGRVRYPEGKIRIGWAGDKPALYPDWTVGMLLAWQAEMQATDADGLQAVIAQCRLNAVLDMPCKALSHGYRQRVSLALALLVRPDVLLVDEPGNGLDVQQREALRAILRASAKQAAVLMIHHDIEEVLALADRVCLLENATLREVPLPERGLLWCEWQDEASACRAAHAVHQVGRFTAHHGAIEQFTSSAGLVAVSSQFPAAAFFLYEQCL